MRKFLLILVISIMMTESIYACKTPEELMDNYFNDFSSGYLSNNILAGLSPDRSGSISITWLGIILVMLQSVPKSWK